MLLLYAPLLTLIAGTLLLVQGVVQLMALKYGHDGKSMMLRCLVCFLTGGVLLLVLAHFAFAMLGVAQMSLWTSERHTIVQITVTYSMDLVGLIMTLLNLRLCLRLMRQWQKLLICRQ